MPYIEQTYKDNFSLEFQNKIMHLILKDSSFLRSFRSIIRANHFETFILVDTCRIVCNFFDKYNVAPSIDSLFQELEKFFKETKKSHDDVDEYIEIIDSILDLEFEDSDYIKDSILEFVRHQEVAKALTDAAEKHLKTKDFGKIHKEISDALATGELLENLGLFLRDKADIEKRLVFYNNKDAFTYPLGFTKLDGHLDGGISRGELMVIMSATNVGKSMIMVNIGANLLRHAVIKNKNITHIILEPNELKCSRRYDSCITGIQKNKFQNVPEKIKNAVFGELKNLKNNIVIKYFPKSRITPLGIRNYLHNLEIRKDFKTDILLIDYADLISPDKHYSEKRHNIASVYSDLVDIAGEFDIPVITPTQTNRSAFNKEFVSLQDASEDMEKIRFADIVLGVTQTPKEIKHNPPLFRIQVIKARENKKYQVTGFASDFDCARMHETNEIYEDGDFVIDVILGKGKVD